MAYIVDGNNVMGQTPGWHRDKQAARLRLLRELAAFARVKGARVTVVFDGKPERLLPDGSAFKGVKVLYANKGSDADSRIARIVESSPDRRGLTVVTSDRHLAFLVRSDGARVMRSGEFRRLIEEATGSTDADKQDAVDEEGIDAWLDYFGRSPSGAGGR